MKNLLLLHGALGYGHQFDGLQAMLANEFRIFAPNFSGHGGGLVPENLSIHKYAQEIAAFVEQNIEGNVCIFGHSMGGYVGLYMAAHKMAPIDRLMTLGTKLNWTPDIAANEARMLDTAKLKEKVPVFAKQLETIHGADWEVLCHRTAAMLKDMGEHPPLTDTDYEAIDIPVQLSIGDRDKMVTLEETINAYRKVKKGLLLVMPNTPHPYEQVDVARVGYKLRLFMG